MANPQHMRSCNDWVTSKQRRRNLSNYVCDFTDKSLGSINEKGQLVCEHPGSKQPWDCYYYNEQLATNKLFKNHCKKEHRVAQFIYFCKCGFSSETSESTGTHMRYRQNTSPLEQQLKCECWKFSSETKNRLQVHISVCHKSLHNEKLKEKEKNFEFECLAKTVTELKKNKVRNVNKVAGEKLGRTEQGL